MAQANVRTAAHKATKQLMGVAAASQTGILKLAKHTDWNVLFLPQLAASPISFDVGGSLSLRLPGLPSSNRNAYHHQEPALQGPLPSTCHLKNEESWCEPELWNRVIQTLSGNHSKYVFPSGLWETCGSILWLVSRRAKSQLPHPPTQSFFYLQNESALLHLRRCL